MSRSLVRALRVRRLPASDYDGDTRATARIAFLTPVSLPEDRVVRRQRLTGRIQRGSLRRGPGMWRPAGHCAPRSDRPATLFACHHFDLVATRAAHRRPRHFDCTRFAACAPVDVTCRSWHFVFGCLRGGVLRASHTCCLLQRRCSPRCACATTNSRPFVQPTARRTTVNSMIHTHVLNRGGREVRSPLDR